MDMTTRYMGLELSSPLVAGAVPLWSELDAVRRLEASGAAAVVLPSLFEEQVMRERLAGQPARSDFGRAYQEGLSHFSKAPDFIMDPDRYLEYLARLKAAVSIPIIASINCTTPSGWVRYAQKMEAAGADALELNLYFLAFDPAESSSFVEQRYIEVPWFVRQEVRIPIAVKLSPFITSPVNMARLLEKAGADALVLFNRFYQPDIDIETRQLVHRVQLSDPSELLLRLRWVAALRGHVNMSLAVTGGVHSGKDVIKAIMAGADSVQIASVLLRNGPEYIGQIRKEVEAWMTEHGHETFAPIRACMSLEPVPAAGWSERAEYAKMLQSWKPGQTD